MRGNNDMPEKPPKICGRSIVNDLRGALSRRLFLDTRRKSRQVLRVSRPLRRLPLVEQTAAHLREGFQSGRWAGLLPGVVPLAEELMVSKDIAREALNLRSSM